ncbi:MAG TPA: ABC transporter permease, partial [Thermoanaerobaculia bacterium]
MTVRFFLRTLARESRGARGRLAFFVACLAVGVSAVVAVAGLSASLREGIRVEARQLLAADLRIQGSRPVPPLDLAAAGLAGAQQTEVAEMVSVVAAPSRVPGQPGPSQVVELKAGTGTYPFYGKLVLSPNRPLGELLRPDTAVVAQEILTRLGLRVGDTLQLGGQGFRIAGVVVSEPDRISISLSVGPRVFISGDGLARTGLEAQGSRISHKRLVRLADGYPATALTRAAASLRRALPNPAFYRVETYREAQPALRENLSRVERFLGLVALLSLFVGGIGVAQSVRAWLAGRLDAIAVLKC